MQNATRNKGKNIILFPDEYIVVDIETTGLDPTYDDIIEIGAIHVKDGNEIARFSELIRPECGYVSDFITALTGITNEMLWDAEDAPEVLPRFMDFVGNHYIVGHNVNFDINFIYDSVLMYFNTHFQNDYIDTMRISRKLHPDWKHNRLSDISEYYGVDCTDAHRALRDCVITKNCFLELKQEVLSKYDRFDSFYDLFKRHRIRHSHAVRSKEIVPTTDEFDSDHPLYSKVCVFTGALDGMTRKEAMQLVVDCGGLVGDGVTKKTNYLIIGNFEYNYSVKDGKSSKMKKAEQYKLDGQDIEIISENVFYDMISPDTVDLMETL